VNDDQPEDTAGSARGAAALSGPIGVWLGTALGGAPAGTARSLAARIETLGYATLWIGEAPGLREAFTHAGLLLANTERLTVATGIANIRTRDPLATAAAARTLSEAYPGRFVLGLGTSHAALMGFDERQDRPLTVMREYLAALDRVPSAGSLATVSPLRVVAALRPKMQALGRDHADGVHTFCVPPAHTAETRTRVGEQRLVVPEQAVVVDPDPVSARAKARVHLRTRLAMPNYVQSFYALGFDDRDVAGDGSDRLVDTLVAWGDASTVASRLREHLDAGADQVAVHPIATEPTTIGNELQELAEMLIPAAPAAQKGVAQ